MSMNQILISVGNSTYQKPIMEPLFNLEVLLATKYLGIMFLKCIRKMNKNTFKVIKIKWNAFPNIS